MPTEADLLAAVLAHPDEDTPRLAYADWLDEHAAELPGRDPQEVRDRAEFIRLQIHRENHPDAVPSPDEDAVYDRLHRLASASWLPPLPAWATNSRFARGFVEPHVVCSANDFIHRADELFAAAPVRRVRFGPPSPPIPDLARCPHLRRIRAFEFGLTPLSPADLRALFGSPHLGDVHELWGGQNNLANDEGLKALAGCPAMASLRTLHLAGAPVTADGLAALASSPDTRELRSLAITGAGFGYDGVRALAAWPGLRTVTHLRLDNGFNTGVTGPDAAEALAASPNLGPLARLSLSGNWIGERGVAALGRCDRLRSLRELSLAGCSLGEPGLSDLFGGGVFAGLRSLDLSTNGLGVGRAVAQAAALAAAPPPELHTLNLADTWLRAEALTALAAAPWIRTVQNLNLDGNKFEDSGVAVLAAAPLDGIRVLDLSSNYFGDKGAAALAAAPWLRGVRRLNLSFNDIEADGAVALANSPHLTNLEHLSIDGNPIGVAGVRALLDSPAVPPDTFIFPKWDWYEEDERAKLVAQLAKYGDRVMLPEP